MRTSNISQKAPNSSDYGTAPRQRKSTEIHIYYDGLPMVIAKVSAIHDISLGPVPISGARTSTPGPIKIKVLVTTQSFKLKEK